MIASLQRIDHILPTDVFQAVQHHEALSVNVVVLPVFIRITSSITKFVDPGSGPTCKFLFLLLS
jgi:hypothetical protein